MELSMTFIPNTDFYLKIARGEVSGHSFVHKFGSNRAIGTTIEPIASSGTYQTPTSAQTLDIVSDNTNDTSAGSGARTVTVEGLDGSGNAQTETVTMNGTTPVTLSNTWLRVFRMYVATSGTYATASAGSHSGTITLTGTAGGPTWAEIGVVSSFPAGQTQIGAYTVPAGKTAYILTLNYSIDSNKSVSLYFFKRENITDTTAPVDAMRVQNVYEGLTGNGEFIHSTYEAYPALTDIGFMGSVSTGTGSASVEFELLLIDN